MPTVTLKLDDDTQARVRHLAVARRRTPHWMMKEAIATYLEHEEAEEALRQEALASWEDYQATGLHVTHEEMRAWLLSVGTDKQLPLPEPHL